MSSALRKPKSQNYLNKNLQALHRRSSQMAAYLENEPTVADVQPLRTRTGPLSLRYDRGSKSVHLHSTYDPMTEALTWCQHVGQQDWQIGVIFGLGLGYHVEELARQYPNRTLVVVEPSADVLSTSLQVRDLRSLLNNPRFLLITGTDPHATASLVFEQNLRNEVLQGKIAFLDWPVYRRLWPDFWNKLQRNIGELAQQTLVNISTYKYFSLMWQENFLTNVRASVSDPSAKALYSLFKGKPAILVSAGPSLQKNIHLLKEAKNHALVIAAGSAIGPLLAQGIMPHFVVSYDAAPSNYYVFSHLDTSEMILLYSAVIYPRILAEYKGPRLAMGVDVYPYERWFFEKLGIDRGNVASGPSVANLAWDLLRQMGCDPIIFVGQDLAYGFDGKAHAEGRKGLEFEVQNQAVTTEETAYDRSVAWTEDIWGNRVRTRPVWLAMKTWFEQRIRAWGSGRTFIDATEGGARIEGTQVMSLTAALDQYCKTPINASAQIMDVIYREKQRMAGTELQSEALLRQLSTELTQILAMCESSKSHLSDLNKLNKSNTLTEVGFAEYHRTFAQLDVKLSELNVYKQFILPSIAHRLAAFEAMSASLRNEANLDQKGERLAHLYASLFAIVRDATVEIQTYMQHALGLPGLHATTSLADDLDVVASVCRQIDSLVEKLALLANQPMTEGNWIQILSIHEEIGKLSGQINNSEVMRGFVKEIVEENAEAQRSLQMLRKSINSEQDWQLKAKHLAAYHGQTMQLVNAAIREVQAHAGI